MALLPPPTVHPVFVAGGGFLHFLDRRLTFAFAKCTAAARGFRDGGHSNLCHDQQDKVRSGGFWLDFPLFLAPFFLSVSLFLARGHLAACAFGCFAGLSVLAHIVLLGQLTHSLTQSLVRMHTYIHTYHGTKGSLLDGGGDRPNDIFRLLSRGERERKKERSISEMEKRVGWNEMWFRSISRKKKKLSAFFLSFSLSFLPSPFVRSFFLSFFYLSVCVYVCMLSPPRPPVTTDSWTNRRSVGRSVSSAKPFFLQLSFSAPESYDSRLNLNWTGDLGRREREKERKPACHWRSEETVDWPERETQRERERSLKQTSSFCNFPGLCLRVCASPCRWTDKPAAATESSPFEVGSSFIPPLQRSLVWKTV